MTTPGTECPAVAPESARIITPRKHGQILIEPAMDELRRVLTDARKRAEGKQCAAPACGPESRDELGGLSRVEISRRARAELVAAIRQFREQIEAAPPPADILARPWVMTGHQVEFYHAGVWAKAVAVDALARASGAVGIDLLVDHDVVEHLGLDVPARDGDKWIRRAVEWGAAPAWAVDGIDAPASGEFERWVGELKKYPLVQTDALEMVLQGLQQMGESPCPTDVIGGLGDTNLRLPYTTWMSAGRKRLEEALDVEVLHVPTSSLCDETPWLAFVIAWARHAEVWGRIYNENLARYRWNEGIHNPSHPMPDLAIEDGRIEMPFWVYHVGRPRERMVVEMENGTLAILCSGEKIPLNEVLKVEGWDAADAFKGLLGEAGLVIRPRALSLTMFVRLFLADLFIHGIGGALYDQITNGILREIFGIAPPYACVSAAWLLPLGQPLEASSVSALRSRRHHVKHNPHLADEIAGRRDLAGLMAERDELILHLGDKDGAAVDRDKRREMFRRLHAVNAELHAREPGVLGQIDRQIATALEHEQANKVLLWREWFFGLHTMGSLRELVERVRGTTLNVQR
jgi:hypothetical protein